MDIQEETRHHATESDRLARVVDGLMRGDISECLAPDVQHAAEVLTNILVLNNLAPGVLDEMLAVLIPYYIGQQRRAVIAELAQRHADEEGFGDEWREAIKAGSAPNQKEFRAKMTAMYMKATGLNQQQAIKAMAEQLGKDEDSIRRSVTRAKARKRPKK